MFKYFIIFFFIIFITNGNSDNKNRIIENLNKTQNLIFKFEQNIKGEIKNGNCIIQYPKKIFCKYSKNKILVSNGKSLVIKTKTSYYRYPLKKTPFNLILDKDYLINKIYDLEEKIIEDTYINYTIIEKSNKINIFFDNKTFNLIGWEIKDIYQNLNIVFFSSIKKNQYISKDLFKLPSQN